MEELMANYLANELSAQERAAFEARLVDDEQLSLEFESYLASWHLAFDIQESFDTKAAWNKVKDQLAPAAKIVPIKRKTPFSFLRIAATLVLLAVAGYFVVQQADSPIEGSLVEVSAETSGTKEISLPDGTQVKLNANSKLTYQSDFQGEIREVTLEGVADFNVTRDESTPFVVNAGHSVIRVLGTSFDVSTNADQSVELNVTEGSVSFGSEDGAEAKVVKAGQRAVFNFASKEVTVETIENLNFKGWWTRKLEYSETDLKQVLDDLEKTYWVQFDYPAAIGKCKLTATFENQNLEGILDIIKATFTLSVDKSEENKIKLDGKPCDD